MPLRMPVSVFGGINQIAQEETLVNKAYQAGQGGLSQTAPLESPNLKNVDFTQGGIRKRKGSTLYKNFTATGLNILLTDDVLVDGYEWTDPLNGAPIEVIVSKKTIYTNVSGEFAQISNGAGTAYAHVNDVSQCTFAEADGHLFIGLDGANNYIQVYRTGNTLDDALWASDSYGYIITDSAAAAKALYVDDINKFAVNQRISIDTGNATEEFNYVTGYASVLTSYVAITNPQNKILYSVTYGNGLFVAVGYSGATGSCAYIVTSPDGITWTARTNPQNRILYSVTYGNGLFVAVGENGATGSCAYIVTSPDGITWTARANPKNFYLHSVTYGNGLFVAVGDADGTDAYVVTSADGITWTERANPQNIILNSVTYGNSLFVAVGLDYATGSCAYIVTSPDGITWTARTNPQNIILNSVTYGNSLFVAVGYNNATGSCAYIVTSPDGITWTARTNPQNLTLLGATYGNGLFVAVGYPGATGSCAYIVTSPDGITWTARTNPQNLALYGVIYGNGIIVSVGDNNATGSCAYIINSSGQYLTLANDLTNTHLAQVFTERANAKNFALFSVTYGNGLFVAVGNADGTDSYIVTSPDGITWTERANPKNFALYEITYGDSLFVAVGNDDGTDAYIVTSADGITWTERANPKNFYLRDITYGNGLFVAVGNADGTDAYIVTSADGITWTERANPKNFVLLGAVYGNSLFVAVGNADGTDAYIVTSADGITWTERANPKNFLLYSVTYGNGLFVAAGAADGTDAYIVTSADGITWTERANPKNFYLHGVTYGNGLFVAVGEADGTDAYVVTSPQAIFVRPANRYTETFDTSTQHTITGAWDSASYIIESFQTRLLMSTGNTLVTYTPEAYTSGSGIWDITGSTAGFLQAAGNIKALSAFAPNMADSIQEALYIGTDAGFDVTTGFTENDRLIRIEGAKSPINHKSVAKSLNWLIYLTDDKNIMAINGSSVINLGNRLKSFGGSGYLDLLDVTSSKLNAYGFYNRDKSQAIFSYSADSTSLNEHMVVIDMAQGEPIQGENQQSFEQRVRCLYWNLDITSADDDWFIGMYQKSSSAIGILPTGFMYTLESGNRDFSANNIQTIWTFPEFTGTAAEKIKQWFRLSGTMEGQTTGTPQLTVAFRTNRVTTDTGTDTWSLLVGTAQQVPHTLDLYRHSYSIKFIITSTDQYEWVLYNLALVFDIGAEIIL